ncbi:hypothetical protein Lal_00043838 [Lupinus albus]|nr:hypothetical protein Lal_00043838 [Lupinus albus]
MPPINLSPNVRVVSPTDFKGLQGGTFKIYPAEGVRLTKLSAEGNQAFQKSCIFLEAWTHQKQNLLTPPTVKIVIPKPDPLPFFPSTHSSLGSREF